MDKQKNRKPVTAEHLEKVKRNLSNYMDNETPEQRKARMEKIALHREREAALYRYMKRHKDILKRVVQEVNDERERNDM